MTKRALDQMKAMVKRFNIPILYLELPSEICARESEKRKCRSKTEPGQLPINWHAGFINSINEFPNFELREKALITAETQIRKRYDKLAYN